MSDFTSTYNRLRNGSSKWLKMLGENPNVSDNIIPLSVADMEFQNSDVIKEDLISYINTEVLGYSKPTNDYLNSICTFYDSFHGAKIDKDWIITSPGVVPALATSVRAYAKEGEGVIVFTPVYDPFYEVVRGQNRRLEECPLIYKNNRYEIDFENLEPLAKKDDVKLMLLCNPHNPGGKVWTLEELKRVGEIAKQNNLNIVVDEIHSDFIYRGKHMVFTEIKEFRDITICCTAASKTFNIAGLQCSNIFIPNGELREKFVRTNEVAGIERANVLGMVATKASYEKGLPWLIEAKKVIKTNLEIVENFFTKISKGFSVMKADAGFLAWISFKGLDMEPEEFYSLLDESDIYINKGASYGEDAKYFIRINVGLPTEDLEKALERFKKVFDEKNV